MAPPPQPVWQERFEGDASSVLGSVVSGVVATLEREQLFSGLTPARLVSRAAIADAASRRVDLVPARRDDARYLDQRRDRPGGDCGLFGGADRRSGVRARSRRAQPRRTSPCSSTTRPTRRARSRAKDAALKAVALDRFCDQAHVASSFVYSDLKQHEDAIRHAREAIRLNPDADDGYRALGLALLARGHEGDDKEGFAALERAAARRPRHWTNLYTLGRELLRRQRYQEAIGPYKAVTSLRPNFANSFVNLGYAYSALGQFDMAIGMLQRAVALQPNDSAALNNLATAFYWTRTICGRACPSTSRRYARTRRPLRYMNLGDGYDRLKRASEARSAYERALEQADKEFASSKDPARDGDLGEMRGQAGSWLRCRAPRVDGDERGAG